MAKRKQKFTFKTDKATGPFWSFSPDYHYIKLKKKQCGSINDKTWEIRLQVIKDDINEDGNPNCEWKWIQLKKKSDSLQEAKDFVNNHIEAILDKYNLYLDED